MTVTILLVTGSTRERSTNTAALRTAHAAPPAGVHTVLFGQLAELPAFNPDADPEQPHPAVAALRTAIDTAGAVLFCTPEYAGTLPGSLKNLLDWTIGTGELYQKPVAYLSVAAPGRGSGAEATLRTVLGYVDAAIIEAACVRVFVPRDAVGPDGLIADATVRSALADTLSIIGESLVA